MKRFIKRALKVLGTLLAIVVVLGVILYLTTFAPVASLPATGPLTSGATLVNMGFVSAYVIPVSDGHVVVVDCGNDKEAKAMKAAIGDNKVDAILLTHRHGDHLNGCKALGAPIYVLAAEASKMDPNSVARLLQDDEVLTLGTITVHVYALPGHTVGSTVYVANGVVYFGDGASQSKEGEVLAPPWIFSDDQKKAVVSLRSLAGRLKSGETKQFAFAHSAPMAADLEKLAHVR
jgi:glyoxylase-like metal-dependent hydrolase (beta-lactamase superfamily II)